ncbi:MAG: HEAT repeat domain-containing protein [Candidatus Micrarchaeota archaeon]|nr:HEAT repeat domain-containing protein [Candidatus Micrarchaeota archaeon]MCX8154703.1 HEAT repeat domain-containing protein [Candidatus Micrarchaeota archaeon]
MDDDSLIFSEFRDALFRSFYDDNIKISNPSLFMLWAKKELGKTEQNFGLSAEDFIDAVIRILNCNGYRADQFYEELDNKRWKRLVFLKMDPKKQEEILNTDMESIQYLDNASKDTIARFKRNLIEISKNPKHPNQYQAISILSKIIDDPEVRTLYKELLYDWDENVRRKILLAIKETKDREMIEFLKIFRTEETDDTNLKIINDILSNE